jgi:hypothetical protein
MPVDFERYQLQTISRQQTALNFSRPSTLPTGLLSLDHRNVFSYPDHMCFRPKQGRKAAVQCSDPGNAHQKNDAENADEQKG